MVLAVMALVGFGGGPRRHLGSAPVRSRGRPLGVSGVDGAVDRAMSYTSYVARAGSRQREVALTFDDGPGPFTPRILGILARTRTPATFFVIGRSVHAFPRIVAAEATAGFVVGDHTETHPPLSQLSASAQAREITRAADDIHRAGAPYPRFFRPPYGSFDRATLALLRARGLLMVLWSVDTKDFTQPGAKQIAYAAISGAQPGAIVLMHDGGGNRAQTAAALPRIIQRLRQRGFRLVTVARLIADDPPRRGQPPPNQLSGHS